VLVKARDEVVSWMAVGLSLGIANLM